MSVLFEFPGRQPQIIFDGNSLTQQQFDNGYVPKTIELLGGGYLYYVAALGGWRTEQMITAGPTKIDPLYQRQRIKNIVVAWEVTNDVGLGGANATQAYNNIVTYCTARRAAGFQVVVVTVLPIHQTTYPAFEALRQTVNTNIRNNWATFADAIADIGADSTIGEAGDEQNQTYYQVDQLHLRVPAGTIIAGYVKDAILTL